MSVGINKKSLIWSLLSLISLTVLVFQVTSAGADYFKGYILV